MTLCEGEGKKERSLSNIQLLTETQSFHFANCVFVVRTS